MRIGFQTRVLVPVISILFGLLGGTLLLINRHAKEEFQLDSTTNLEMADGVFQNSYEIRVRNLILRFRGLPNEPRFKAVSQLGDAATMRALLHEIVNDHLTNATALFVSRDGLVEEAVSLDPDHQTPAFQLATTNVRHEAISTREATQDLVAIGKKLFNVVAVPVTINNRVLGVFVFGVPLGIRVLDDMKRLTHCELVLRVGEEIVSSTLEITQPDLLKAATSTSPPVSGREWKANTQEVLIAGTHFLRASGSLNSLDSQVKVSYDLLASFEEPLRKLHATQRQILIFGIFGIILSSAVLCLVVRGVTQPLRLLHAAAERIASGDLSCRVPVTTQDECGELAAMFNHMSQNLDRSRLLLEESKDNLERRVQERTAELTAEITRRKEIQRLMEEAQSQLVEVSRRAGMAEIATSVLHNVGNTLNSLNVSSSLITENVRGSKSPNLARAVLLLQENQDRLAEFLTQDPKGRRLPSYLEALSRQLIQERDLLLNESNSLQSHIDHIKRVVAMQQRHAKCLGVMETVSIESLLEDALRLSNLDAAGHSLQIIRDYRADLEISVDRHKVLQLLVNLLNNSMQALEARASDRRITLRLSQPRANRVHIQVEDNGCGIAPEHIRSIFQHGFTTKADGHGFGLHSGAIAAAELGGSLKVHSDGVGQGAIFTLELPVTHPAQSAKAA